MKIEDLVTIEELKIHKDSIYFTEKTKFWCQLPYPGSKNGCFHYNLNLLCPPNVICPTNSLKFREFLDDYEHFYLIYAIFNFKKYKEIRKEENPEFFCSEARLKCVIYWQGAVKRLLKDKLRDIYDNNYSDIDKFYLFGCGSGFKDRLFNKFQKNIYSMEAAGIYVFRTLIVNEISFELKPVDKILLVCLLCSKIEIKKAKKMF